MFASWYDSLAISPCIWVILINKVHNYSKPIEICIIAEKAVPHVINSRALTGEKPDIYKAIHAL